jgi:hypothetical protein
MRHGKVRNDHVGSELGQCRQELLLAIDQAMLDAHAGAPEFANLEFGIGRQILHHQDAHRGSAVAHWVCLGSATHGHPDGVRLIASQ